ncbi:hypothetical protein TNCV_2687601 [Trichonephila clavipes]|nr:hypothetical protein TNCV_2687601 [Trichonephila clavipes]
MRCGSQILSLNILRHSISVLDFPETTAVFVVHALNVFNWSVTDMGFYIPLKEAMHRCDRTRQFCRPSKTMTGQPWPIHR